MQTRWREVDPAAVERRYDRIAPLYAIFETLWLPAGLRAVAVARLALVPGSAVLEVGCGTGSNLAHLVRAVGARGRVYGVDRSERMLAVARRRCERERWPNCTLLRADAAGYALPAVDGVLFSLCYCTMAHRADVLRKAWQQLRPGGRLVIFDSQVPAGPLRAVARALMFVVSRATVLGNPDVRPLEDVQELVPAPAVDVTHHVFGSYAIVRAVKPG